jgi:hypothetical protein
VAGEDAASVWASFGGIRELAAGLQWVRVYGAWRKQDAALLERRLRWVVRLDPEPLAYWLNGARMLCHDVAAWRLAEAGSSTEAAGIRQVQLRQGLAWLTQAAAVHPNRAVVPIEEAVLHWTVQRDGAAVVTALARAQTCPDAPWFVARLRAEMLRRLDRPEEALAVLEEIRPGLPEDDPAAMVHVVDLRIAELRWAVNRER